METLNRRVHMIVPLITETEMEKILHDIQMQINEEQEDSDLCIDMMRTYHARSDEIYYISDGGTTILIDYDALTDIYPYLAANEMRQKLLEDIRSLIRNG